MTRIIRGSAPGAGNAANETDGHRRSKWRASMRDHHWSLEIDGCPRSAWLRRIEGIIDRAPAAESGIERVPGDDFRFVEPVTEVDDLSAPDGGKIDQSLFDVLELDPEQGDRFDPEFRIAHHRQRQVFGGIVAGGVE